MMLRRTAVFAVFLASWLAKGSDGPEAGGLHLPAELFQAPGCAECCAAPAEHEGKKAAWHEWRIRTEGDLAAALLTPRALGQRDSVVAGRKAVGLGMCLFYKCAVSETAARRCGLSRTDGLRLRLRLSWALLGRGDRADLSLPVLADALALCSNKCQVSERRMVYEHLGLAHSRLGDFEAAALHLKTAIALAEEELGRGGGRDGWVVSWGEGGGEAVRLLRHVASRLEWRLAAVRLVAGREVGRG